MNTFGHLFRLTTFGESHGGAVGVVVDGCPSRLPLVETDIQVELDRRRPGQSRLTTQRKEADRCQILSGTFEGRTLGTPILVLVANTDVRPEDYLPVRDAYRPSHADFTYEAKFGIRNWQGGGRASARETVGRVAAGAIARKLLARVGVEVVGWVEQVGSVLADVDPGRVTRDAVEATPVRCPDPRAADRMVSAIDSARKDGDSLGGIVGLAARNVPAGLGAPVFDKLEADLARGLMSLPASKGFEVGSGFRGVTLPGSRHNDAFFVEVAAGNRVRTRTNRSGGIQGGITNGEDLLMRVAFKPTATILKDQETVTVDLKPTVLKGRGRHDPCVLPRAVPICEAMVALVLADHYLRQRALDPARLPDLGL
jgi:chorismate synthase